MNLSGQFIQYGIIIAYFTFILVKGLLHSRKISDQDDFLVAGRNISWFALLCTVSATIIGGGSSIGAIGKTYDWGVLMLIVSTGWYLQLIFSGLFVAPKFRKLNLYTVAGYFGHRFDEKSRIVSLGLSLVFSIGVLGAQMVAFGKIITSMIPELPYLWAVIIGGSIVIIYSTAGGLMAVINTDVIQFIILFIGFAITLFLCVPDLLEMKGHLKDTIDVEFFQFNGGKGIFFMVGTFFSFLLGETFAPGYVTRFCVGKDQKSTRRGITGSGIFLALTFPIILFFIALYARYHFPGIDGEQALPKTILKLNNPVVGGIIIAALMSAVMSSADSILNSSTAIIVKDIFEYYFVKKKRGNAQNLKNSRFFSVAIGLLGMALALVVPDIIDLLLLTYTLWAPGIVVPVLVGIFSKRSSGKHNLLVFVSMVTALAVTIVFMQLKGDYFDYPAVYGVLVSALIYFGGLPFTPVKKMKT